METLGTKNSPEKSEGQVRQDQTERVIGFLQRIQAASYVQDIVLKKEKVPDFTAFREFLVRINGIARNTPIRQRAADGKNVEIKGFVDTVYVPRQEDKEGLLRYAYDSAADVNTEDLKYMLPAVVNAVHLFVDGNGRTSRVLHLLLREYESEDELFHEMRKALNEDGRHESFDINPGLVEPEIEHVVMKRHGWQFTDTGEPKSVGSIVSGVATVELLTLNADKPSEKMAKDFFGLYAEDTRYALTAIQMQLGDAVVERVSSQYSDVQRISPARMVQELSVEDWGGIIDRFYQLKKEHVEVLVDLFVDPEQYRTLDDSETIRDYFIKRVEKTASSAQE